MFCFNNCFFRLNGKNAISHFIVALKEKKRLSFKTSLEIILFERKKGRKVKILKSNKNVDLYHRMNFDPSNAQ